MIIKGQSRSRSQQLAAHLLRTDQNERVRLFETRGTVGKTVPDALYELEAHGAAAACSKPLYHASISPEAHTPLTDDQIRVAVDTLASALGLERQPRVVVVHEKLGRQHLHVVWSRIEIERNRALSDSWNYRHHEEAARALEALFGHRPIPRSTERPAPRPRTVEDYELRQAERTGRSPSTVEDEISRLWNSATSADEFRARLSTAGYTIARGDRRVFVVVDRRGEVHSLARRIRGVSTKELRARLADIDMNELPSVSEMCTARKRPSRSVERHQAYTAASNEITQPRARKRHDRTERRPDVSASTSRAVLEEIVAVQEWGPVKPVRVDTHPQHRYRSQRAALVVAYAAKIAAAVRHLSKAEIAAAIEALLAERDAAIVQLRTISQRKFRPKRLPTTRTKRLHRRIRDEQLRLAGKQK